MNTLLVMRHGKSSWKDPGLADHDRPLKKRGKRDAPRVGLALRRAGRTPALALCSTARRARQTLRRVIEAGEFDCPVSHDPALYHADAEEWIAALRRADPSRSTVLVVGHNPGLEDLVETLAGEPATLPTAAVAIVETEARWSDLGRGPARLVDVWLPRELDDRGLL